MTSAFYPMSIIANHFPIKHALDGLALTKQILSPGLSGDDRKNCFDFFFNPSGIRNLYATQGRTGFHWSQLLISVALDLASGGDGEYSYLDPGDELKKVVFYRIPSGVRYTKLDWRLPLGTLPTPFQPRNQFDPVFFHTHHPYYRLRCAKLKSMRVVVVVRSIFEVLESYFVKYANLSENPDTYEESDFPWDEQISVALNFYNSWGDVITWNDRVIGLNYNQIKQDPVDRHLEILKHWGFDVPYACVEEAEKRTTKAEMAARAPKNQLDIGHRVSLRKKRKLLSPAVQEHILHRINKELVYDFGYTYDENHQWGGEYK